jgi:hypothetical protein
MLDPREMIYGTVSILHKSTVMVITTHMNLARRKRTVKLAIPTLSCLPYVVVINTTSGFQQACFFLCCLLLGLAPVGTDFRISHCGLGLLIRINDHKENLLKEQAIGLGGTSGLYRAGRI